MASTDYDKPRPALLDEQEQTAFVLPSTRRADAETYDENAVEMFDPAGTDPSDAAVSELTMPVVPMRPDEFVCTRCFLVYPRRSLTISGPHRELCRDCAA